jgi:hypothetical protein
VQRFGEDPKPLMFEVGSQEEEEGTLESEGAAEPEVDAKVPGPPEPVAPPQTDEYMWAWKVRVPYSSCKFPD